MYNNPTLVFYFTAVQSTGTYPSGGVELKVHEVT